MTDKKYDAIGREIKIGDIVVKGSYGQYACIQFARVEKLTKKNVTIHWGNIVDGVFVEQEKCYHSQDLTSSSHPKALLVVNDLVKE